MPEYARGCKERQRDPKWFAKAAEQGDKSAHLYLGCMYVEGESVEKNVALYGRGSKPLSKKIPI